MITQTKAIVAAIVAIVTTVGDELAQSDSITWKTIVVAIVAAILAHQSVFWAPRYKRGTSVSNK